MAFSTVVKDELARIYTGSPCCARAELAGLLSSAGKLTADADGVLSLTISTNHATIARKAYRLCRSVLALDAHIAVGKRLKLDRATFFSVQARGPELGPALERAGIADRLGEPLRRTGLAACCRWGLLRGVFLGAGFIADPKRSYHWEITTPDRTWARTLRRLLGEEGIKGGVVLRRHEYVVYLKDAEGIAAWLNAAGAHQALLSLEDARIYKDVKNRVNRLVNCETANLTRTIHAGLKQQEDIIYLEETVGLRSLAPALRAVARARLANPEATLVELGSLLRPQLGKSGVNHRLRELRVLAEELRRSEGEAGDGAGRPESG